MGGPCLIEAPDGELTNGPICTDNFKLSGFEFEGDRYLSAGALPPSLPCTVTGAHSSALCKASVSGPQVPTRRSS